MVVNAVLALMPTVRIVARQTTTMSASITAYSTAVGPSSEVNNWRILTKNFRIRFSLLPRYSISLFFEIWIRERGTQHESQAIIRILGQKILERGPGCQDFEFA